MKTIVCFVREINDYLAEKAAEIIEPRSHRRSLLLTTATLAVIATVCIWTLVIYMWKVTNLNLLWVTAPVTLIALIETWWMLKLLGTVRLYLGGK